MPLPALILCLACVLACAGGARADETPWSALAAGGRVVLIRHAITTSGVGDPPGMRLEDCSTQRNLTDEGRRHALAIGEAFRRRGIPVERVLSSPWCRCLETAKLAFGRADVDASLSNLFGRAQNRSPQVAAMTRLVGAYRGRGNLVLVSHGSTIVALTGISPATGEMVVVTPDGKGGFAVTGSLAVESR